MRTWYLSRAIPWVALLGCCVTALVMALLLARWPVAEEAFLPVVLAFSAAAAGFTFDEPLPSLAEVTPRGGTWRRTTRLTVALVPAAVWGSVIAWRPGEVPAERVGWWLVGVAAITLLAGLAALSARRGVQAPGALLASVVAVALFVPLVFSIMLGWVLVYPFGGLTGTIVTFWCGVAGVGLLALALALRPGLGR